MKNLSEKEKDILVDILFSLEDMLDQKGSKMYVNDDLTGKLWVCENDINQFIDEQKEYYNVEF